MEDYIIPFDTSLLSRLGLPVVPCVQRWRNSHRNDDYGFYILSKLGFLEGVSSDTIIFQIDNDIGLCGATWPTFFESLLQNPADAYTLGYKVSPESWLTIDPACVITILFTILYLEYTVTFREGVTPWLPLRRPGSRVAPGSIQALLVAC